MEALGAYVAPDRLLQLAGRRVLPQRGTGAALFADVSGFTALTEELMRTLGSRRGAEELSVHLNAVYEALIAEVERYGGSVVAFAGDAITCWFDGDNGRRALTVGLEMQKAMRRFSEVQLPNGETYSLSVKAGIARGQVHRCLVGNPEIQLLDVIAGNTLMQMAEAANTAQRGEVLVGEEVIAALGKAATVKEWRSSSTAGRYAVVRALSPLAPLMGWPPLLALDERVLGPHLLRPVFERLLEGQGEFLTELRPAVALFLRFEGIECEDPEADRKLDAYLRWVQEVVDQLGGFLLAVGMGDKGSHLYCCFGAPIAQEQSSWRAVAAADKLRTSPPDLQFITATRIGISSGTMRTGAYGSTRRRTYGVLGDPVNLAARLMEHAGPGQVLVSENVRRETRDAFTWQAFPPVKLKGKTELVPVLALLGRSADADASLAEPQYGLPLVGRERELDTLAGSMAEVVAGRGQVVVLTAEAGLGKSRLTAEMVHRARERGVPCYAGHCQSHGTNTRYLAWQGIWRSLFGLRDGTAPKEQTQELERHVAKLDPELAARVPLLAPVVNLSIADNDVTGPMEARLRKASLEALLVDCLRKLARERPLLLVIEDHHWIDSLSQDLLLLVARAIGRLPVLLLVTQRPPDPSNAGSIALAQLPYFKEIRLTAFTPTEIRELVGLKLRQLFSFEGVPPAALVERLAARSQGNPFYLEELLNYLKDQHIDFQDSAAVEHCELPASVETLILSRIDRLTQTQQSTLKIASVIGRLFPAAVLWGLQQPQAEESRLSADLGKLCETELIACDRPEPELVYIFRHIITQEVAYEALPHATRARLHEEIGFCLERVYAEHLAQHLDLLAFHFDRSLNDAKKKEYLQKAGETAQALYANSAAISYYERVLPLLEPREQIPTLLNLGKVLELLGDWRRAHSCFDQALAAARELLNLLAEAECEAAMGDLLRRQGLCTEAANWLDQARAHYEALADESGVGQTLHTAGTVAAMVGDYAKAARLYQESLAIREKLDAKPQIASLLSNLGILARYAGDNAKAQSLMEQSLQLRRDVGDRWAVANSLNNLGVVLRELNDYAGAHPLLEESLVLNRQVGDRWATGNTLCSLAELAADEKDWPSACRCLEESLQINLELGDRITIAYVFECFARIAAAQGDSPQALRLAGAASALRNNLRAPLSPAESERLSAYLKPAREALSMEDQARLERDGAGLNLQQAVALVLSSAP